MRVARRSQVPSAAALLARQAWWDRHFLPLFFFAHDKYLLGERLARLALGAIGVLLAWIVGKIMTQIFMQTYLSVGAVVGAIGVSAAAGVASGLFPAWKAARLDPIEALRTEN